MAEVLIANVGLQDTKIGVKSVASETSISTVEGLPVAAAGDFASLVLQLLADADGNSVPAEKPAEGGNTLPVTLPEAGGDDPAGPVELLAAVTASVTTPATVAESASTQSAVDVTKRVQSDTKDTPMQGGLTLADGRRTHVMLATRLSPETREGGKKGSSDSAGSGERGGRVEPAVAAIPAGVKVTQELPMVAALAADASAESPTTSANVAMQMSPVTGSSTAVARAPMDNPPIPIQQRGFEQALGERVVWMTSNRIHSAELQVNPPTLGPIEVRISVSNDQASVSFGAMQPATRDALEAALPRLRELLSQQGLNLADVNVSQHSLARDHGDSSPRVPTVSGSAAEAAAEGAHVPVRATIGMVDVFV